MEVDSAAISRQTELPEMVCGISWSPVLCRCDLRPRHASPTIPGNLSAAARGSFPLKHSASLLPAPTYDLSCPAINWVVEIWYEHNSPQHSTSKEMHHKVQLQPPWLWRSHRRAVGLLSPHKAGLSQPAVVAALIQGNGSHIIQWHVLGNPNHCRALLSYKLSGFTCLGKQDLFLPYALPWTHSHFPLSFLVWTVWACCPACCLDSILLVSGYGINRLTQI